MAITHGGLANTNDLINFGVCYITVTVLISLVLSGFDIWLPVPWYWLALSRFQYFSIDLV